MGTRGFITFAADGENKTTYNHFDSYPSGLGADALAWARTAAADLDAAREVVRALRVVTDDDQPTDEDVERLREFADFEVDRKYWDGEKYIPRERPSWYQLLRRTQGEPAEMLRAGVIADASGFPADSLFAEWGYVIDLTAEVFEVYEGFQTHPHKRGRFAEMQPERDGYYPVRLRRSWPLADLPTDEAFDALEADQ
jgi:hypothetical protein